MSKLILLTTLFLLTLPAGAKSCSYIRTIDGDTVVVNLRGKDTKVRLAFIDCPESDQPYGYEAKSFTHWYLRKAKKLELTTKSKDKYGRVIGIIEPYFDVEKSCSINTLLLSQGLAWAYYTKNKDHLDLEAAAKENEMCLWRDENPIPPWQWRKKK